MMMVNILLRPDAVVVDDVVKVVVRIFESSSLHSVVPIMRIILYPTTSD